MLSPEKTEKKIRNFSHDSQQLGRGLDLVLLQYIVSVDIKIPFSNSIIIRGNLVIKQDL